MAIDTRDKYSEEHISEKYQERQIPGPHWVVHHLFQAYVASDRPPCSYFFLMSVFMVKVWFIRLVVHIKYFTSKDHFFVATNAVTTICAAATAAAVDKS